MSMFGASLGNAIQVNVWICALATDRELESGSSKNTNVKMSATFVF